jgi:hypothetical protein
VKKVKEENTKNKKNNTQEPEETADEREAAPGSR